MKTINIEQMKAETIKHLEADAVIQGEYWEADDNEVGGHGCFIGCLVHSASTANVERKFGMPLMLVKVAETIFENLHLEDAKDFFKTIPEAIAEDGKDLSNVVWTLLASELRNLSVDLGDNQKAVDRVISGLERMAAGGRFRNVHEAAADVENINKSVDKLALDRALQATRYAAEAAANFNVRERHGVYSAGRLAVRTLDRVKTSEVYRMTAEEYAAGTSMTVVTESKVPETQYDVVTRQRDTFLRLLREAPTAVA